MMIITFHQVNVGLGRPPIASQTNSLDLNKYVHKRNISNKAGIIFRQYSNSLDLKGIYSSTDTLENILEKYLHKRNISNKIGRIFRQYFDLDENIEYQTFLQTLVAPPPTIAPDNHQ